MGAGGKPFKPEVDELNLWAQAQREEEQLQKKSKLYDDPLLDEYLAKIGDKLTPDDVREAGGPGFKFGVLRDPTLNAFAMPNGRVYIHTGLLARLDNEAQLAMIVGHEMTHVTNRHALSFTRDAQHEQIPFTVVAVAASIGVAVAAGSRAGRAGYDPKEAPKVFDRLRQESKDRGSLETFFFGSHPKLTERVETTTDLIKTNYAVAAAAPDTMRNTDEFALRMRTVVRENARLDIQAGRFKLAEEQLDRVLTITPRDPVAQLYYGDLHRLQSQRARDAADKADKAKKALERYERAAELDPAFADPFRQLAFLYYQQKDNERAKAAFQKYLALKPDAPDARRIKEYLIELDR